MSEVELTISVGQKEPSAFRLVATLVFASAVSGLFLSAAYQVTKPIIDANNARELKAAVFKVVPGSTVMQKLALRDGQLIPIADDELTTEEIVYGAYNDDGRFVGYAIENSGSGFQDTIRILYGYDPKTERVIGMEILESRETPGLGDKIWKDESFVSNFSALAVNPPLVVVKDGRDQDNEVDVITGATISSKAVVKIINQGNEHWLTELPPPGQEPPLATPPSTDAEDELPTSGTSSVQEED